MTAISRGRAAPRAPSRSFVIRGDLKGRWGRVPDAILQDTRLSDTACRVLCWVSGRPDKWVITIDGSCGIKASLGLSKDQWARVMKELRAAGIYTGSAVSRGRERVGWELTFDLSRYYS